MTPWGGAWVRAALESAAVRALTASEAQTNARQLARVADNDDSVLAGHASWLHAQ